MPIRYGNLLTAWRPSNILHETVGDVTECPICTETMVDPRVLSCIHTFCFKCLDQLWKDKQPGVKVPCPMCRTEVVIPVKGVSSLQKNYFVDKLVGAQMLSKLRECSRDVRYLFGE